MRNQCTTAGRIGWAGRCSRKSSNHPSQLVATAAANWRYWRSPTSEVMSSGAGHWSTLQCEARHDAANIAKSVKNQQPSKRFGNVCEEDTRASHQKHNNRSDRPTLARKIHRQKPLSTSLLRYSGLTIQNRPRWKHGTTASTEAKP